MNEDSFQPQLFDSLPLLGWLPDETLFSLASRIHFLSGRQLASETSISLFGGNHSGIHHDFPNCLDVFEQKTQSSLGTGQDIAFNKTLLKYYRAFIPVPQSESIAETMRGSSVAHLKFQLGLITSRFRANHPLKACPICIEEDRKLHGWGYWHLEHQYPGVWWCDHHDTLLQESTMKSSGVERFLWHLPSLKSLRDSSESRIQLPGSTIESIMSLSQTTKLLVKAGHKSPWDPNSFWLVYRKELSKRGWLVNNRLRYSDMCSEFLNYSNRLRLQPEFKALPTTINEAKAQLGRLFRCPRSGTHPLRHIILIDWLFGGIESFVTASTSSSFDSTNPTDSKQDTCNLAPNSHQQDYALKLLYEQNMSMRSVSDKLGIDINVIMSWAVSAGIPINRRPKTIKDNVREELILKLQQGIDKSTLAVETGVSTVTINRLLRTTPGLQAKWKLATFNKALNKARIQWKSLIKKHSHLGTKFLRNLEPAVYAWLYRNDRDWLREHSPHRENSAPLRNNSTLWEKRDLLLCTEVKRAALVIIQNHPKSKIHLWQLYQQIPELKAKLDVLHRLPLTQRAIEEILVRPTSQNIISLF